MDNVSSIGLELAKNVFQLPGVNAEGKVVLRKKLKRSQVLDYFEGLPPCLVGIEIPEAQADAYKIGVYSSFAHPESRREYDLVGEANFTAQVATGKQVIDVGRGVLFAGATLP